MSENIIRTVEIEKAGEEKQFLLVLPPSFIRQFPTNYQIEMREADVGLLELAAVKPTTIAMNRRYKVVHHNGSSWVSIPRSWLRDQQPRDGDKLEIIEHHEPTKLFVRFRRACAA